MKMLSTIGTGVLAAVAAFAPAQAQEHSFAGQTIEIVVATNPGTSLDTGARIFAEHWSKFIPGNPTIVVQNLAAAGGNQARNQIYETGRTDGTQLVFAATALQAQLLDEPGVRFDHRDMTIIAAMEDLPTVTYIRRDVLGSDSAADIVNASGVVVGGIRPSSSLDMFPRAGLETMGVEYGYVSGYQGASAIANAVRSGEVSVGTTAGANYLSVISQTMAEDVVPLWYYPSLDASGVPQVNPVMHEAGVPNFLDVYGEVHGAEPSGPEWEALQFVLGVRSIVSSVLWGPPDMEEGPRDTLRAAFEEMFNDTTFQEAFVQALGTGTILSSIEDAERAYRDLDRFAPTAIEYWKVNTQ